MDFIKLNSLILIMSLIIILTIYSLFNYNPIYSLIFFIATLFDMAYYLFNQQYEFIILILNLIYFGAILILFFYLILLLNLQVVVRDNKHIKQTPWLIILILITLIKLFSIFKRLGLFSVLLTININKIKQAESIGYILFNDYFIYIIIISILLIISLIGIVLMFMSTKKLNIIDGKVPK